MCAGLRALCDLDLSRVLVSELESHLPGEVPLETSVGVPRMLEFLSTPRFLGAENESREIDERPASRRGQYCVIEKAHENKATPASQDFWDIANAGSWESLDK